MNNINSLNIGDFSEIGKFIGKHSHLKKIKFQNSTFCQDLLLLSQIEKEKFESIKQKIINRAVKFIVEKENNLLVGLLKEMFDLKDKRIN